MPRRTSVTRRSTSRCSATAVSTTRGGAAVTGTDAVGDGRRDAGVRRRRVGALRPGRLDSQANDLADDQPDKLAELQRLFIIEAGKYNVFPLDDRRSSASTPISPDARSSSAATSQLFFGRMGRLSENSVVVTKNKSHAVTAQIDVPDRSANGVIIAQGGAFGGFALYAKDGKPAYCYNLFGLQRVQGLRDRPHPGGGAPDPHGVHL